LVGRLAKLAKAERWRVPAERFARTLESSAAKAFAGQAPSPRELERYLSSLHLEDLALACACAAGDSAAWDYFILEHRPVLYRAADALEPGGGARELADPLYGELFGLAEREGERQSLFRYFHGRSSLATWLRAVLAQRYVDRVRSVRRSEELPEEDSPSALAAPAVPVDPDRDRYHRLMRQALERAVAALPSRDRLRLACYYAQDLTLAKTARLLGEHEATASRHLAKTRAAIGQAVEHHLRTEHGLSDAEIAEAFASVVQDAGSLDLHELIDVDSAELERSPRKKSTAGRST
jgi:RNA polymerase sigma-70 factor (ECF subfamily)